MIRRFLALLTGRDARSTRISFLDMPNELILQVAKNLSIRDLSRLLRTNHFLAELLSPALIARAVKTRRQVNGRSVLHWASAHNRLPLLTLLLDQRASVNTADCEGMTPLHSAVIHGYDAVVRLLLRNGGDANAQSYLGWTPLLLAAITGNPTVTKLLVENGAKIDWAPSGYNYQNALHHAAALGYMDVIEVLLEMGCDRVANDFYGMDAAQIAALFGQKSVVDRLLELGGFGIIPHEVDLTVMRCGPSVAAIGYHMRLFSTCLARELDI